MALGRPEVVPHGSNSKLNDAPTTAFPAVSHIPPCPLASPSSSHQPALPSSDSLPPVVKAQSRVPGSNGAGVACSGTSPPKRIWPSAVQVGRVQISGLRHATPLSSAPLVCPPLPSGGTCNRRPIPTPHRRQHQPGRKCHIRIAELVHCCKLDPAPGVCSQKSVGKWKKSVGNPVKNVCLSCLLCYA
jgi:hypothetical protein